MPAPMPWPDGERRIDAFAAAIFDLDGVVTKTADVHAAAWKRLFDDFLRRRSEETGEPFRPFDSAADYAVHVDGKPRYDGVSAFLASRGISLPFGDPDNPPEAQTVCGLGNRKNALFRETLARDGVDVFDTTVAFIRRLRQRGVRTALVSSSRNARAVLDAARLTGLFDACIDGNDAARQGLRGKPAADIFLAAARALGTTPSETMVFEDAESGVAAGQAGDFGLVVGIDRTGHAAALQEHGADVVVKDLAEFGAAAETNGA